jgi:hypothetical protein
MSKKTSKKSVARNVSDVMSNPDTGDNSKSCAGSALSQSGKGKTNTSAEVASKASKALRDGRASTASKSVAGSALSQRS